MVWPVKEEALSARCLFQGYQGSVYEVERQGSDGLWHSAVMKLPPTSKLAVKDAVDCKWPSDAPTTWGDDQLWICVPCSDDLDFFYLYNRALGTQVLEVHGASAGNAAAALRMAKLDGGDHQKWQVDGDSRLASKLKISQSPGADVKFCIDVIGARDENSAEACAYNAHSGPNQQWQLEAVEQATGQGPRLVRIVSAMAGRRALAIENGSQTRKDMILEICYLTSWASQPGLVQLQQVVWSMGIPQAIVLERLGKQLGKGTGDDSKACVLQDIRNGLVVYTPASAARSLLPVAQVLRRMHQDGYVYNDLHDGNILHRLDADTYKMIDLGSVTSSDQWLTELGGEYDSRWSINRDWRAFTVALLQLWLHGRQLDVWALVGTNSCIKVRTGHLCRWSSPLISEAAGVPDEVETMVADVVSSMEADQVLLVRQLLSHLFAHRCDADGICAKLDALAQSG